MWVGGGCAKENRERIASGRDEQLRAPNAMRHEYKTPNVSERKAGKRYRETRGKVLICALDNEKGGDAGETGTLLGRIRDGMI